MPTVVQFRRGTTVQNNNFLGANGEISVDTTLNVLRVADGATQGGFALVGQNSEQTITNKIYQGNSVSVIGNVSGAYFFGNGSQLTGIDATSIQNGTSNVRVVSSGGNVTTSVGGTSNVVVTHATGMAITGDLSVTGNATVSGNILGDRIQNGTTQIDIQSPGGNANITVGGTSNVAVFATTGAFITGLLSATGDITGGNIAATNHTGTTVSITGAVTSASVVGGVITGSSTSVTGTQTAASTVGGVITGTSTSVTGAQTAASTVGGVITGSSVSVTGNITGGNILINGSAVITGNLSVLGTETIFNVANLTVNDLDIIVANNVTGGANVNGAGLQVGNPAVATWFYNNATTSWQTNIAITPTTNGTLNLGGASNFWGTAFLTTASATGDIQGGNLRTAGLISATGSITGSSVVGGVITGASTSVTGAQTAASTVGGVITGSSVSVTGTINGTTLTATSVTVSTGNITGGNLLLSGAIEDSGPLDIRTTASNGNITLTPNGTGVIVAAKDIVNGQANGVGNIGSASNYFNTVFAKATSAQYADLAEMYCADAEYAPGTVVDFGGTEEITATVQSHSTRIAGIISTNPSYLMNSALNCTNALEVALVGRVPCRVVGIIDKGDRLVASHIAGVACRLDMTQYQPGCIVGKALEAYHSDTVGTIEVAVGRI